MSLANEHAKLLAQKQKVSVDHLVASDMYRIKRFD
jgi:hypothetical protein